MSEVEIVAEMRAYALEGCPTTDTFNEWADYIEWQEGRYTNLVGSFHDQQEEIERLRAENIEYKEKIARAILYSDDTSAWL